MDYLRKDNDGNENKVPMNQWVTSKAHSPIGDLKPQPRPFSFYPTSLFRISVGLSVAQTLIRLPEQIGSLKGMSSYEQSDHDPCYLLGTRVFFHSMERDTAP